MGREKILLAAYFIGAKETAVVVGLRGKAAQPYNNGKPRDPFSCPLRHKCRRV